MNSRHPILALVILGVLAAEASSKNAVLNASNVTIVSIDEHRLVVSRTVKGKTEEVRFVLNPETVRMGNLNVGSHVTVHYKTQNHENIATSIQARELTSTPLNKHLPE
jgi:hypothetical protein